MKINVPSSLPSSRLGTSSKRNPSDLDRFLRVNHAGERAAQAIYKGQLAMLKGHPQTAEIRHMMEQEQEHLNTFDALLNKYKVRPSIFDPLWGAAGFILGATTAAMGPKGCNGVHHCR